MGRYVKENAEDWTKVGAKVVQIESTNDSLREQVQAFAKTGQVLPEGYSLRTEFQTAGKGRLGRVWDAKPGKNLLISYLLTSAGLRPDQLFLLLQSVALAVRDTVQTFVVSRDVEVKWPNDILVEEKKIAGILIESVLAGDQVSYVVVGIGLKINQLEFDIDANATSLAALNRRVYILKEVMDVLTRKLQSAQFYLKHIVSIGDAYALQQRYHTHLFGFRQWLHFRDLKTDKEILGKLLGVLQSGELRLEQEGEEHRYSLNDLKFLRKYGIHVKK